MSEWLQEFRQAGRAWMRRPGLAAAAVVTLSLGLGAATAIWSLVRSVVLQPLPYSQPERLAMVFNAWRGFEKTWVNPGEMLALGAGVPSVEGVAYWNTGARNLSAGDDAVQVVVGSVSASTFSVLGSAPAMGRVFSAAEDVVGGPDVVVLSQELFEGQFQGDTGILGQTVRLDGRPHQVIGVMPRGFQLPTDFTDDAANPSRAWVPRAADAEERLQIDGSHGDFGAVRLRADASLSTANAQIQALVDRQTQSGQHDPAIRFRSFAISASDEIEGPHRLTLALLAGSALFLLIIACANVAHLLLGRADARQSEMAVRLALGASTSRLGRQMFVEGLILALLATAIGAVLASSALRAVQAAFPLALAKGEAARVEETALAVGATLSVLAVLGFAVLPGLGLLKVRIVEGLQRASLRTGGSRKQRQVRRGLVAAQLAFAALLSVGGLLIGATVKELGRIDVGFRPEGVLSARLRLPRATYESPDVVNAYYRRLLDDVRALPGVTVAGFVRSLPLGEAIGDRGILVEGLKGLEPGQADWQASSEGTIEALGETLKAGRGFLASDVAEAPQVAVVNEAFVRRYWPSQDALGRRFRIGGHERPWVTVVGVVGDVRHNGLLAPIKAKFYRPFAQFHLSTGSPARSLVVLARTDGDPMALSAGIQAAARALDPQIPLAQVRSLEAVVGVATAKPRFARALLFGFGGVALLLCAIGVYGALSAMVQERRREIGIRRTLGASVSEVVRLVGTEAAVMGGIGVALGLAVAAASSGLVGRLLYGVRALDPLVYLMAGASLLVVAAAAAVIPAVRACAIDPSEALRDE